MPAQQAGRGGTQQRDAPEDTAMPQGAAAAVGVWGSGGLGDVGGRLLVCPCPKPQEGFWAAGGFMAWQGIPKLLVGLQQLATPHLVPWGFLRQGVGRH